MVSADPTEVPTGQAFIQPIGGSEGLNARQTSDGDLVTRSGVTAADADFDIKDYDLVDSGDWNLKQENSTQLNGTYPDVGGTEVIGIFIESSDDVEFVVEVHFVADDDTLLGTVDHHINSNLRSTSPTGGNHYVYETVAVASDYMNVIVKNNDGAAADNVVSGSVNAH